MEIDIFNDISMPNDIEGTPACSVVDILDAVKVPMISKFLD